MSFSPGASQRSFLGGLRRSLHMVEAAVVSQKYEFTEQSMYVLRIYPPMSNIVVARP